MTHKNGKILSGIKKNVIADTTYRCILYALPKLLFFSGFLKQLRLYVNKEVSDYKCVFVVVSRSNTYHTK